MIRRANWLVKTFLIARYWFQIAWLVEEKVAMGRGKKQKSPQGLSIRAIEEAKQGLATPNDRRQDYLFASAPDFMSVCWNLARTSPRLMTVVHEAHEMSEEDHHEEVGDSVGRTRLQPRDLGVWAELRVVVDEMYEEGVVRSETLLQTLRGLAEEQRQRTIAAVNHLLVEDDCLASVQKLQTELKEVIRLSDDGVRAIDQAVASLGGLLCRLGEISIARKNVKNADTHLPSDEGPEGQADEERLLRSMRSAYGLVESLFSHVVLECPSDWAPLGAQVIGQLASVVDSIVSAGALMRPKETGRGYVELGLHLTSAIDAQLHFLSVLCYGSDGSVATGQRHENGRTIQFLAAMLEHEHQILVLHRNELERHGIELKSEEDERFAGLCRQAAEVARNLREADDLSALDTQAVYTLLKTAAEDGRALAATACHVTGASPLAGKGPATPKLPRDDGLSAYLHLASRSATIEISLLPAVVDNSRFHAELAVSRLSTSHDSLLHLPEQHHDPPLVDIDAIWEALCQQRRQWTKLRRLFARSATLSTLAADVAVGRLAALSTGHQQLLLCGVGLADFVRQQIYSAVFEVSKISLLVHTVCAVTAEVWSSAGLPAGRMLFEASGRQQLVHNGNHLKADCSQRQKRELFAVSAGGSAALCTRVGEALRTKTEELARRIALRLRSIEAGVASALPPT